MLLQLAVVGLKASVSVFQEPVAWMGNASVLLRPAVLAGNVRAAQKLVVGRVVNAHSPLEQAGIFRQLFKEE